MRLQTTTGGQTTSTTPQTRYLPTQWPDAVALREAIQNPQVVLGDRELRASEILCDRRGLPITYAGRCAVVFRLRTLGGENWALRCFTQGVDAQERRERYTAIARRLESLPDCFVPFRYLDEGVKVFGQWFPCVAMRWAQGDTLGRFVEQHAADPASLRRLSATLADLRHRLESAGIAHGDWQHDNLLVSEGGRRITLVDYDGMYVPELAGRTSPEIGHPNYQHPLRTAHDYGVGLDRFAHLVIQTGLLALARDASLWTRFNDGESLLFKKTDLLDPAHSRVFHAVRALAQHDDALRDSVEYLEEACYGTQQDLIVPSPGGAVALPPMEAAPAAVVPSEASKWWMATEQTRTNAAVRPAPAAAASGLGYLERVQTAESGASEQKILWGTRAGMATLFGLCLLLFNVGDFFPWWLLINLFNVHNWVYAAWPRKKVYDELSAEIQKLEKVVMERRDKIEALRPSGAGTGASGTAAGFVQEKLRKTSISQALGITGISLTTLGHLRAAWIDSAADVKNRTFVPGVATHEIVALHQWCSELEIQAANEYRQSQGSRPAAPGTPKQVQADISRLEHEIAGFEAALEDLHRERDSFPDTSTRTYYRKVFGLTEA